MTTYAVLQFGHGSAENVESIKHSYNHVCHTQRQTEPIKFTRIEECYAGKDQVTQNNINNLRFVAIIESVEEDYVPECVQEDDAECKCGAGDEKYIASTGHAHRSWTNGVRENIDTLE